MCWVSFSGTALPSLAPLFLPPPQSNLLLALSYPGYPKFEKGHNVFLYEDASRHSLKQHFRNLK